MSGLPPPVSAFGISFPVTLTPEEQDKFREEVKKRALQQMAERELAISKRNAHKVQEAWLKIMRASKTKELKKELEVVAQNHERDVDRKDAIIQMLHRDLDESEEQHQVATRSHMLNVDELWQVQQSRLSALEREFNEDLQIVKKEFAVERKKLDESHALMVRELELIIQYIDKDQEDKAAMETNNYNTEHEVVHTKIMEEDTQTQFKLDHAIAAIKEKCSQTLQTYKQQTDARTNMYRKTLNEDDKHARAVDKDLRRHKKLQEDLAKWRTKLLHDGREANERNEGLIKERDLLLTHFQALKADLRRKRDDQHHKLASLAQSARLCQKKLKDQLKLAEKIVGTAQLCRKLETEREKICPLYKDSELNIDELQWESAENTRLRKEALLAMEKAEPEERTYLDNFFKRFNKALLDKVALDSEHSRLDAENAHLRSVLKQFLEGVSVNPDIMDRPNPLVIVNGRSNLNFPLPRKDPGEIIYCMEASHSFQPAIRG